MNRYGKCSLQTHVAKAFLNRYAELNSLPCPTGRGSFEELPIRWLASNVTRAHVHAAYTNSWKPILDAAMDASSENIQTPMDCLTKDSFCKVWKQYVPWLKILKIGSDFCDSCTFYRNALTTALDDNLKLQM